MEIAEKLAEFFALGRERGWDTQERRWKVIQLMDAKGITPTLDDLGVTFLGDTHLKWSGDRYGALELRANICSSQGYRVGEENILVTLGTQQANMLAFVPLITPGDEILFELPTWMHAIGAGNMLGAKPRFIRRCEDIKWRFDLDHLEQMMASGVKVMYLCNPNNPTGSVLRKEELHEICEIADKFGVWIVCDEVYRGLEWEGVPRPPAICDIYERGISTSSVSKTVGLDSLRLGWIASSNRTVLADCARAKQINSTPHVSYFDESVATAALEPGIYGRLITSSLTYADANRTFLTDWVSEHKGLSWQPPEAGFLSFPAYTSAIPSWKLCVSLLELPYRVYLIPGICYDFENHLRIAFGPNAAFEQFKSGLDRLNEAIKKSDYS